MTLVRLETVIVGAGLSGLAIARSLTSKGGSVKLFEARDRAGGRILSLPGSVSDDVRYDLGPAWVWPHNTRMLRLVADLDLPLMRQHASGKLVFQDQNGLIRRDVDFATMGEALRLPGGLARLTDKLAADLPPHAVCLKHAVSGLEASKDGILVTGSGPDGAFGFLADRVVLAMPPRLVAARIAFRPALTDVFSKRLNEVPTWMAGHAKIVAIYERAFWRGNGLSGDAISHRGPLFEIHDASSDIDAAVEGALFGFVAPGRGGAKSDDEQLRRDAIAQLVELFGPEAAHPLLVHLVNWAKEPATATSSDMPDLAGHPRYRNITLDADPWQGRVVFSGTETAPENGGFLEGALEAAERF
ncbi:NAD(P)/FAD-dependent oxidoreductase [Roseibium sp. HPY-6]|uniref:flavin monoamine oxidase family protein n=1 Tax=Roseibium sp. HPY-6 TaxID=3229852 RepID=UPI00338EC6C0